MLTRTKDIIATIAISIIASSLGCASNSDGQAILRIVGDSDLQVGEGQAIALRVRYQDDAGQALAGEVSFRIEGDADAELGSTASATDVDGVAIAELRVAGRRQMGASFAVIASAEGASSVRWSVTIGGLDVSGRYRVSSRLDIAGALEGDVSAAVDALIDMTDGDNDPATYMIDQMLAHADLGVLGGLIAPLRWLIDPALNQLIIERSPTFVVEILELGDQVAEVITTFGLESDLDIRPDRTAHAVTGISFSVDAAAHSYQLEEFGLEPIGATEAVSSIDASGVQLSEHTMEIPIGSFMVAAINRGLIPSIDPQANNLAELFTSAIDCDAVGAKIAGYLIVVPAEALAAGCNLGLIAGANEIEARIESANDAGFELTLSGTAEARDRDSDGRVDELTGVWTGDVVVGDDVIELSGDGNHFTAERVSQ